MFFTVPERQTSDRPVPTPPPDDGPDSLHPHKRRCPSPEAEAIASYYPKRTPKACDRCRLKKARCSGGKVCEKCKRDGVICTSERESKREPKAPNAEYVHLVEAQRDSLLRALNRICKDGVPNDPAAMTAILQNLGGKVEDLKQVPKQGSTTTDLADSEGLNLYGNITEIQAMLGNWKASAEQHHKNTPMPELPRDSLSRPEIDSGPSISPNYFDYQVSNTLPQSGAAASLAVPADIPSAFDMSFLTPTGSDDWLLFNASGDTWSLPFVDFTEGQ